MRSCRLERWFSNQIVISHFIVKSLTMARQIAIRLGFLKALALLSHSGYFKKLLTTVAVVDSATVIG